ncbi:hypothetical protein HY419_01235 [candidate division WWE3 bacterium]|nr:hypothetical protein [candidate division WWE3 bacterium]
MFRRLRENVILLLTLWLYVTFAAIVIFPQAQSRLLCGSDYVIFFNEYDLPDGRIVVSNQVSRYYHRNREDSFYRLGILRSGLNGEEPSVFLLREKTWVLNLHDRFSSMGGDPVEGEVTQLIGQKETTPTVVYSEEKGLFVIQADIPEGTVFYGLKLGCGLTSSTTILQQAVEFVWGE